MNISFYNNYFLNKEENYFRKYILILFLIIFVSVFILFLPHPDLKMVGAIINKVDDDYYILLNIDSNDLEYINDTFYVENKMYKYKVINVKKEKSQYYFLLKVDLPKKNLLNNYPINITLMKDKISLGKKIKNKMKGWFVSK